MLTSLNADAKENTRLAREWLEHKKIPFQIDQRGKHPAFVLRKDNAEQRVTFAGSPSAYAGGQILKDVKVAALRLGYLKPDEPRTRSTIKLSRRAREIGHALEALARRYDVHVSFHQGGVHPYALFERDGQSTKLVFSGTPSDRRTVLNQRAEAKRIFEKMGWAPVSEEEKSVVGLVSTGKGSMFDAQSSSQGPASPVKVIKPSGETDIMVAGVAVPKVPEIAKKLAGTKSKGPPAYQAWMKKRNAWLDAVFEADPKTRWEDVVAALELAGYKTTLGAVQQALRVYRLKQKKTPLSPSRTVFPKPQITVDMAAQLRILRDPPQVPEFARRVYDHRVTFGGTGVPYEYRQWSDKVRYPWAVSAFNVGATTEQVAGALRRAGHPITDSAAMLMERRWRRECYEATKPKSVAEKPVADNRGEQTARRAPETEPEIALKGPAFDSFVEKFLSSGGASPMDTLLKAINTFVDGAVAERLGGLDIEGLKKKAAKWDAYQQVREAKRKMAELDGDEN